MDFNYLAHVRPQFSFLLDDHGFRFMDARCDDNAFGNFYVDLSSDDFLFRLTSDRNVVSSFLASLSEPTRWYDVSLLRAFWRGLDPAALNRIGDEADFLREDYEKLKMAFSKTNWPDTREKLAKFGGVRAKKLFGNMWEGA